MPQRQERHRSRHSSKDEQPYIILVQDIPRHCRWQELKDMTRSLGGEQSLKAEVFNVGDGTQLGHCTIKGRADAVKVYENLCTQGWNGYRVRVKLVAQEKDGSLRKIEGPKESNGIVPSERPAGLFHPTLPESAATTRSSANPLYTASAHPSASMSYTTQYATMTSWATQQGVPSLTPTLAPTTITYPSGICLPRPSYLAPSTHASSVGPPTPYSTRFPSDSELAATTSSASPPVRRANDGSKIFISGLPYYQSESELRGILKRYGSVIYLEIHPDSRNPGKNKGTARARYKSPAEALVAVRDLDGRYLSNRKISVKQEKDEPSMTTASKTSSSGSSRSTMQEAKSGSSSSKQKKIGGCASKASSPKSRRSGAVAGKEAARGPSRANRERTGYSSGSTSPQGPLVVNGARRSSTRRGSWGEKSADDSDDSSDDSECSEEGATLVDDEEENEEDDEDDDDDDDGVQKRRSMHHRGRL